MFLRKTKRREPAPVTMSGVRMGERLLQIGVDDPKLAGALAAKVGLSGSNAIAVEDAAAAERATATAVDAGVLADVHVSPLDTLPVESDAFDIVVVHSTRGRLSALAAAQRVAAVREWHRVVRKGGRILIIETGVLSGLRALIRSAPATDAGFAAEGGAVKALEAGGFRPVRVVGQLEGLTFTEGLKS